MEYVHEKYGYTADNVRFVGQKVLYNSYEVINGIRIKRLQKNNCVSRKHFMKHWRSAAVYAV